MRRRQLSQPFWAFCHERFDARNAGKISATLRRKCDDALGAAICPRPEASDWRGTVTDKIEEILAISPHVRYVAIYQDRSLKSRQRSGVADPSASESDKYEELFVNPTLLKCATQRGELDCGGLRFIVIGYGHFLVLVMPIRGGHVTVGFEQDSNPLDFTSRVAALFDQSG